MARWSGLFIFGWQASCHPVQKKKKKKCQKPVSSGFKVSWNRRPGLWKAEPQQVKRVRASSSQTNIFGRKLARTTSEARRPRPVNSQEKLPQNQLLERRGRQNDPGNTKLLHRDPVETPSILSLISFLHSAFASHQV